MQAFFGFSALFLNISGYLPYIRDILSRKVQPHRVTWGIWAILTTIIAFNQVENGGAYSSLFFISAATLVITVFLLSFRYGMGGASRLDKICLFLALALLAYWLTIHETHISTVIAIFIDILAALPTLIKTYQQPKTETYTQWVCATGGGLLTLLAVPRPDFILLIYPLYTFIVNGAVVGIKYWREG